MKISLFALVLTVLSITTTIHAAESDGSGNATPLNTDLSVRPTVKRIKKSLGFYGGIDDDKVVTIESTLADPIALIMATQYRFDLRILQRDNESRNALLVQRFICNVKANVSEEVSKFREFFPEYADNSVEAVMDCEDAETQLDEDLIIVKDKNGNSAFIFDENNHYRHVGGAFLKRGTKYKSLN